MKNALVTGASGFLGAHVTRILLERGVAVRALVRATSRRDNLEGLPVELTVGDLREPASLGPALRGCDALFHVAADYRLAAPDPRELYRSNVEGTRSLLESALKAGVGTVVYTSSVAAVGHPDGGDAPGTEADFPDLAHVIGDYKRSKCMAEDVAREYAAKGLRLVIVNPSTPIGAYDVKPTPTGRVILDFLNGRMPAYMETGLNYIHARDAAFGHWLAAEKGRPGERYILGHQNMMLKEFLDLIADLTGLPRARFKIPYPVGYCLGAADTFLSRLTGREPRVPLEGVRMARRLMFFDASKAVRELGLPQTPIREAVEEAVAWFRSKGCVKAQRATA